MQTVWTSCLYFTASKSSKPRAADGWRKKRAKEKEFPKPIDIVEKERSSYLQRLIKPKICAIMRAMKDVETHLSAIGGEYREKFEAFRALLLEYNEKFNLTAVTEEKEVTYKHFLDSAMGEALFPQGASVAEVGSGAGFPSVPLKILRDDLKFTLIESTGKKCGFLRLVIEKLDLKNVTVCNLRAEEAGKEEAFREKFDVCCARAVARLNTLSEYCLPLVKIGGRFIAYKGAAEEEIKEAQNAVRILGGRFEEAYKFELPEGYGERTLVVVKKTGATPVKYPRGRGKERNSPL